MQFVWGVAFIIASIFFGVVEMAVDTVLLSFCEDCEENGGVPRYAPPLLMDALTRHAKALDDEDAQKKAQLELELAKLNRPRA
jgi:choline transporter-like protein 2/4/5